MTTRVAVIGAGYVGLTTAACLAHLGHRVVAVDVDERRVEALRSGRVPILEEGLDALVREGLSAGRLSFTTDAVDGVRGADFVFLCVPTPQGEDGSADLGHVHGASRLVGPHLAPGAVVVTKSTVPVGSAGTVHDALGRPDVAVVSNPEFLREGSAVADWLQPDRVVVGSTRRDAAEAVAELYRPLGAPVVVTDPASSETVKYAANAFLAAKVSFVNAIANVCEAVGANVSDVLAGMAYDRRIGSDHLSPGPGWGGSCLPKDTAALLKVAADAGYDFALLREAVAANRDQFDRVVARVEELAGGLSGRRVAVWGLTFKAGTDDLRESPALAVVARLLARGASVAAYDPTRPSGDEPELARLDVRVCGDAYEAAARAAAVVLLTEWPEFATLDFAKVAEVMDNPAVLDARNALDADAVRAGGCRYRGIGRR